MSDLEDWNDFYDVVMPENRNTQRVDFHACKPILLHLSTKTISFGTLALQKVL